MATATQPKGFIAEKEGQIYFHANGEVYRAPVDSITDCRSGYLQGRWECSITQWNRFAESVYGLPKVAA